MNKLCSLSQIISEITQRFIKNATGTHSDSVITTGHSACSLMLSEANLCGRSVSYVKSKLGEQTKTCDLLSVLHSAM